MIRIFTAQGKGGRWRWLAYRDGKFKCISRLCGWRNEAQAVRDAKTTFGDSVTIDSSEEGELFAAEREFDNI